MNKKKKNYSICLEEEERGHSLETKDIKVSVRDLVNGYSDKSNTVEGGVVAYGGKLDVRPKFQRAYVVECNTIWKSKLVNTILNNRPAGTLYFGIVDNGAFYYEDIDGQQRIMTICDFAQEIGGTALPFTINGITRDYYFKELPEKYQKAILDYEFNVTLCKGTEDEIHEWFQTINQPSSILTEQELRNVSYCGRWLESAKEYFSTTRSTDKKEINDKNSKYRAQIYKAKVDPNRQECLEMALDWVSYKIFFDDYMATYNATKDDIAEKIQDEFDEDRRICYYMAQHKNEDNANDLITEYKKVIDWVRDVFFHNGLYSNQTIQSQEWGRLYAMYSDKEYTEEEKIYISKRCELICSGAGINYSDSRGIYEWVIRGEKDEEIQKFLHFRQFNEKVRYKMWQAQGGICPLDNKYHEFEDMQGHHIKSWKDGGLTDENNLVMLYKENHMEYHFGKKYSHITGSELREMRDRLISRNRFTNFE